MDNNKDTLDFLTWHVGRTRAQQRAGEFFNRSKNSVSVSGKDINVIASCSDKNKLHEIILIEDENTERFPGDAVTASDVFASSENVVWNDTIKFETSDGILVSVDQYDYIQKYGPLPQYSYFGKTNNKDSTLMKTWRELSRKSSEARKDKAKDILYLTLGSVTWTREEATQTKPAERVTSPLLLCPITESVNSKDKPRFTISADNVKINSILRRELKLRNIDVFLNVPEVIPFGNAIVGALDRIAENARYTPNVDVDINDFTICILNSTNETICQLIEKNIDKLAESPLIKVLAGAMKYEDMSIKAVAPYAIYPLLADDTQREVMEMVRQGHSINISAAAGTGKSQTIANIIGVLVSNMRSVLALSEKAAANEVVIKYLGDMGLDKFVLSLDKKITVPEIVNQIDRIRNNTRVFLDPIRSRDLLNEAAEVESLLEEYNQTVYDVISGLDMTLYELIGEAIVCDACSNIDSLKVCKDTYRYSCRKLDELQEDINNTVSDRDFISFMQVGTTGDEETDELINATISDLKRSGVDIIKFVSDNNISVDKIAVSAKSNMARILAQALIFDGGLEKYGNVFLRAKYAKLTEYYSKLRTLYAGFIQQQIGERIAKAVEEDKTLIPMLERIKTSRMSTLDFFKKYGAAVIKLCPIVVSTPTAAVNYITDEMNVFDALLIDEASQVPIISVLPFLIGNRQLIAFGDNMQLDITSFFHANNIDNYDENGEYDISRSDKSILHVVAGKGIPTKQLRYHYRSKTQHLVTVSNKLCYNGNLNIVPDVYTSWDKLPENLGFELRRVDVPFNTASAIASKIQKKKKNKVVTEYPYLAEHERRVEDKIAEEIALCVSQIREETPEKSIGVITLNDHFQDKVIDALEDLDLFDSLADDEGLFVRSLENAQGREADVVIIAIEHDKRNIKGALMKNISGFFNGGEATEQSGNNRLNVLFTRAREKNIIFLAFDYNEIRDSERSLKRLYTYLEYAATGNMSCESEPKKTQDRANERAAIVVANSLVDKTVRTKIGEGTLSVDIGVMRDDSSDKYDVGFIMPDRKLTPNALCTKINLLERAGWRVLPLSLIYLLEKSESFKTQLPKMIANTKRLGSSADENFLTEIKPAVPLTLEEIATRGQASATFEEQPAPAKIIKHISTAELAREGIEDICRLVCDDEVRSATQSFIDATYRTNYQSFLIKLAQNVQKYAELNDIARLNTLSSKVFYLYKNLGEKRACYLLAELLRLSPLCEKEENQAILRELFDEAVKLKIIKEVK